MFVLNWVCVSNKMFSCYFSSYRLLNGNWKGGHGGMCSVELQISKVKLSATIPVKLAIKGVWLLLMLHLKTSTAVPICKKSILVIRQLSQGLLYLVVSVSFENRSLWSLLNYRDCFLGIHVTVEFFKCHFAELRAPQIKVINADVVCAEISREQFGLTCSLHVTGVPRKCGRHRNLHRASSDDIALPRFQTEGSTWRWRRSHSPTPSMQNG